MIIEVEYRRHSSVAERIIGNDEVASSILAGGTMGLVKTHYNVAKTQE